MRLFEIVVRPKLLESGALEKCWLSMQFKMVCMMCIRKRRSREFKMLWWYWTPPNTRMHESG